MKKSRTSRGLAGSRVAAVCRDRRRVPRRLPAGASGGAGAGNYTIGFSNPGGVGNGWREACSARPRPRRQGRQRLEGLDHPSRHGRRRPAGRHPDLIAQGVNAIIINPADPDALNPGIAEAIAANIPVIAVDASVTAPGAYNLSTTRSSTPTSAPSGCSSRWAARVTSSTCAASPAIRPTPTATPASRRRSPRYPDIKVVPSDARDEVGSGHGHPADQRHHERRHEVRRHLDVRHRLNIVDALKTANHDVVPIVGADNAGFVTQLLNETGLEGAAVTNPPPSAAPASTWRPRSSPARSPTGTDGPRRPPELWDNDDRRGQGQADRGGRSEAQPALAARPDDQGLDRRTRRTRSSPARAPASSLAPDQSVHDAGVPVPPAPLRTLRLNHGANQDVTAVATDLLLDATEVEKRYGAVVALRSASLAVRPGEVHALMGANGAGKSTLVKILTGAVQPDGGTITVRGRPYAAHSPAEARRGGIVSVYQEPALIPDLDVRSNLRLTRDARRAVRHWLAELGLPDLDLRHRPRPAARVAPDHRPRPRAGHRARRPDARRDDRGAARQPDRARPRGHRPPAAARTAP